MKLKPRHRWFAHVDKESCEDWCGPHKTIEEAVADCVDIFMPDKDSPIFVATGHKMTKAEWGDMEEVEFSWEVDIREMFEIRYLKDDREIGK